MFKNLTIKQRRTLQLVLAVSLLCISFIVYKITTAGTTPPPPPPYCYSNDDGQTYFFSHDAKIPPYNDGGKEVVQATLFVGQDKKPFVGFVFKYSSEGQAMLAGFKKKDEPSNRQYAAQFAMVKRPGDKQWVPALSPTGRTIIEKVVDPKSGQPASPYEPS